MARITRVLNDAGIPCPSAADPKRNPHRSAASWTLRTVAAILANPRYTGRQVWKRQRTDFDLIDPANTALGHKHVPRWNLPEGRVISKHPAHATLVSEAESIAAQEMATPRGPAGPAARRYLLAGLLACGRCGRRLESAWSNGKPAYRCRHGYASATRPGPGRPNNIRHGTCPFHRRTLQSHRNLRPRLHRGLNTSGASATKVNWPGGRRRSPPRPPAQRVPIPR